MNICKLIILGIIESCVGTSSITTGEQMDYTKALEQVVQSINDEKNVDKVDLLRVMPTSNEEAITFYKLDYDKSTSEAFQKLDKMIVDHVRSGNADFMNRYLRMSPYVDGYFAEAYFDNIDYLSSNNQELFCSFYTPLSQEEKRRLKDYSTQCK